MWVIKKVHDYTMGEKGELWPWLHIKHCAWQTVISYQSPDSSIASASIALSEELDLFITSHVETAFVQSDKNVERDSLQRPPFAPLRVLSIPARLQRGIEEPCQAHVKCHHLCQKSSSIRRRQQVNPCRGGPEMRGARGYGHLTTSYQTASDTHTHTTCIWQTNLAAQSTTRKWKLYLAEAATSWSP